MAQKHHIFWWNLENLFDVENSPDRPDWLKRQLSAELKGWTETVLDRKIANLSSIIAKMKDGQGPDILGVCEIENKPVVERLIKKVMEVTGRQYTVMHHEANDGRGIDVAVIYDTSLYRDDGRIFTLEIMKRNATRDLFQVNLTTQTGNDLIIIGNHWPSRLGGQFESEPYRIMVAETLGYWVDRIVEIKGKDVAVVAMGDFNDEPFNRSITVYLKASNNLKKISNARSNYLYNLMWPFLDGKLGTHVYGSDISVIDQFMVSKSVMSESARYPFRVEQVSILNYPELVKGEYQTPVRFGQPSSELNLNGYSDHLPIELILVEKENL